MADGLFGDDQFGQFISNPMTQLAIGLLAAPRHDARGFGTTFGQQLGAGVNQMGDWQQMVGQMRMQQMQQQKAMAEQAFRERMQKGEFNTPAGSTDWNKMFEAGIASGAMPLDAGMRLQEAKENREERLAANREANIQRAELMREQMAQRGEIARDQIEARRQLAGMTNAIAGQNAATQRMLAEARIADMKKQQAVSPFANTPTYKSGVRIIEGQLKELPEVDQLEGKLKQWAALNNEVETGPVAGRLPTQIFNPQFNEMKKLESSLAMTNFKSGQGAMSNLERSYIVGGGPNTASYKEANLNNITLMRGAIENMRELPDFQQAWLDSFGSLKGATEAWQKYLNANPRYIRNEKTHMLEPNPKRQDWMTYMMQQQGRAAPSAAPTTQAAPAQGGWTVREVR